jgi:aminotransferase
MGISVLKTDNENNKLKLSQRLLTSNVSLIKEMMYLAEEERRKGKSLVSLGVGIPFYRMPEPLRESAIKNLKEKPDIDKYTFFAGLPKLRQIIAQQDSEKMQMEVTEDNILVTPGSMAALLYTATALIDEGDEVILISPYFPSYAEQTLLMGGVPREVALIEPADKNDIYHLDLENIEATITPKTKAVILNSPNNPSGAVFAKDELIALAEIVKKHDIYVITDEVYEYLNYSDRECFNIASIKELWPKVVRCCSFSKKFGMTGWRIGYIHASKELITFLLRIHDNTIVCAPHIAQETVYSALQNSPTEILEENHRAMAENRALICQRLDKLSDLFTYIKPNGAYYIFPKYSLPISSVEMSKRLLYEAGVITIPGIGFGEIGEHHLRLSFGGSKEEINEAFDRIEKWYNK